jgi:hypothetical protein
MHNIIILSLPRSGSSLVASLVASAGYNLQLQTDSQFASAYQFNKSGYNEEVTLTLLNDQIIRMKWGSNASNLFIPSKSPQIESISEDLLFSYDLDETSVYFPDDFFSKVEEYTGTTWDVWGLSRMQKNQKWYKAYSAHRVSNTREVLEKLHEYRDRLNRGPGGFVLKDPRLGLTLGEYALDPARNKVIVIQRTPSAVRQSMRNHYGKNLFTSHTLPGPKAIVSNHFNYHIQPQSFEDYHAHYLHNIDASTGGFDRLTVDYEQILDGSASETLEDFIGAKIDRSLIHRSENHFSN